MDTWWTGLRWRIACWLIWRGLKIAPEGSAACNLEDRLNEWAGECRKAWAARYPKPLEE